jgi:hypothetical protein
VAAPVATVGERAATTKAAAPTTPSNPERFTRFLLLRPLAGNQVL